MGFWGWFFIAWGLGVVGNSGWFVCTSEAADYNMTWLSVVMLIFCPVLNIVSFLWNVFWGIVGSFARIDFVNTYWDIRHFFRIRNMN